MKVLVIGGGGREHALVWKLSQSPHVSKIFCAPGNAGISDLATCISLQPTDIAAIADWVAPGSHCGRAGTAALIGDSGRVYGAGFAYFWPR